MPGNVFEIATHLVVHDWPDSEPHNTELQELVLGKEADDLKNGITRSNAGGWQASIWRRHRNPLPPVNLDSNNCNERKRKQKKRTIKYFRRR